LIGDVGKKVALVDSVPIGFSAICLARHCPSSCGNFVFDLVIQAPEKFADRFLKYRFIRQGGLQAWHTHKPFIPAGLGTTLSPQEKRHFLL
jgi:hypothetical protein